MWCVGADKVMRFHRHRRQTLRRGRKCGRQMSLAAYNLRPDCQFLGTVEKQSTLPISFFPFLARKVLPVNYVWRRPCRKPLGPALAMELCSEGACGSVARCNQNSA